MDTDIGEYITVQPYDYTWCDNPEMQQIIIKVWSLDQNSNVVLVSVRSMVRCWIELPRLFNGRNYTWNRISVSELVKQFNELLVRNGHPEISQYALQNRKLFYYHQINQRQFINLEFKTHASMKCLANSIKSGKVKFNIDRCVVMPLIVRESDLDPVVNLLRILGTSTTQWLKIKVAGIVSDEHKKSKLKHEYLVNVSDIKPVPDGMINCITKPGIFSFDIECYSENHNMMPNKKMPKDVVYIITCCYQQYSLPQTRRSISLVMGEHNPAKILKGEVRSFNTELELIAGLGHLIEELNPVVLLGHNIFGFDYPYLDARLKRSISGNWYACSMMKDKPVDLINKAWESSAYGRMETNYLDCEGRMSFDLYPYSKRNLKLDNYKLDTVAKTVLGEGKFDMPAKRMFAIYKSMLDTTGHVGPLRDQAVNDFTDIINYAIQDAELPIRIFDKKIIWVDTMKMAEVTRVTPFQVISRGLGLRGYNMTMELNYKHNIVLDERKTPIPPFNGGFVGKPVPGIYDDVICLDFKSLYPSIMIAHNLCPTTLVPPDRERFVNLDHCWVFEWESEYDPAKPNKKYDINDLDEDDDESDDEDDDEEAEKPKRVYKHRYVFYRGGPEKFEDRSEEDKIRIRNAVGMLPRMLSYLIDTRDAVKEQIKTTEDPTTLTTLKAKENALKITANATYGTSGSKDGKTSCCEVALCTTYIGRKSINKVNEYLRTKYGANVVYNDTDSSMVQIPGLTGKALMEKGKELADEISDLFYPLRIEFEKAGRMLAICPKKYIFWMYDNEGKPSWKADKEGIMRKINILYKGVVATRRDNSPWLRQTYRELLDHILENGKLDGALDIVFGAINNLVQQKVPLDDLVVTKQLRAEYASQTATMALFASELSRIGSPATPGERIPYIVVKDQYGRDKIGYKMRSLELYNEARRQKYDGNEEVLVEPIDEKYYIEKGFMKPIQQLLGVAYRKEFEQSYIINKISDMKRTYSKLCTLYQGKYGVLVSSLFQQYPLPELTNEEGSFDRYVQHYNALMDYLANQAPGKTNLKKIISKYYKRHLQPDMRINNQMVKNYLRYKDVYADLITELKQTLVMRQLMIQNCY